ncbi:hypothetical protein C0Q70_00287 [Pomacea canaliculata]|uniref:Uncharacterized protein n=1 Tax=Pomacea canaliculata TaxID=400727 RepID=A0A2T7PWC3_POMCA|nr:serine/threonine-protein phosphatase 6 regulatory ankyrin repeat subunit A-like [Pomacea canaliculata]PVD37687.1 hypothetical protein C0Q70_00287 [Pomacea canaliculata]
MKHICALVDVGADVNAGQFTTLHNRRFALTPLHFALIRGTLPAASIVKVLVKSGADLSLEAARADSRVPCVTIVRECSCGICLCLGIYVFPDLLLPSHGARYDGQIKSVGTALHLAVKRSFDLSDILSEKQHRPLMKVPDGSGYLPLHSAVKNLNQKAIKILLSLGADVNAKASGNCCMLGRTALHILFNFKLVTRLHCIFCSRTLQPRHHFKKCVSLLLQQPLVDLNERDWQGRTPLHVACESGHYAFIEQLVACGANVLVEDNRGGSPLSYAACPADRTVREMLVDVLLRCGAVVSCLNTPFYRSPVRAFYSRYDVAILLKLHNRGAITPQDLSSMLCSITIPYNFEAKYCKRRTTR